MRTFLGPFRLGLGCLGLKLCAVSYLRVTALGAWPWPQRGSADSEGASVSIWGPRGALVRSASTPGSPPGRRGRPV